MSQKHHNLNPGEGGGGGIRGREGNGKGDRMQKDNHQGKPAESQAL